MVLFIVSMISFIDMLFVDADHSKEAVAEDFKSMFPFVTDQEIIILHDGYPFASRVDPVS